jgi:hypothetical protein
LHGRTLCRRTVVAGAVAALSALAGSPAYAGQGPPLSAGPAGGVVPLREAGGAHGASGGSGRGVKLLSYHNGSVMTSGAAVKAIFWGPGWSSPGDEISGLDGFYGGIGGSSYLHTNVEYTQAGGAATSNAVSYAGHALDGSSTPSTAPSTSAVLTVVARNITSPVANGYYPVYSDRPRGTAGYCAWHSYGTVRGTPVQFAFFFRLDGDSGCDPQSGVLSYSQGLAAVANVSGHELSEALTDPALNAWYDQQGAENADKCAWTFGPNVFFGGSEWRIQGNWSNAAYFAGTSYRGSGSGCIQTS